MSPMGRLMVLVPWAFGLGAVAVAWAWPWGLVLWIYLLPPALHRLHGAFFPLREGAFRLVGPTYVPWWGSHQIQVVYIAFPAIEALLRLLGLYSPWLRLWGSRVGNGVYWTPIVEITDRSLLDIGDGVVVGHRVGFYAHAIAPRKDNLSLVVKQIRVGAGAFLGAASALGPGVVVEPGAFLPVRTDLGPGRHAR